MQTHDLTTEVGVVEYMKQATSSENWDNRADDVVATNNGYPPFWYMAVFMSGVAKQTTAKWGGSDEMSVTTF